MITSDFHTHTCFSDDCETPFETALESAGKQGIEHLAVTDHYDPGYPNPDFPFILDFDNYLPALQKAREKYAERDDFTLAAGIEVGIMEGQLDNIENALNRFDYDVVIGSFHCYRDLDISDFDFSTIDRIKFLEDFYEYIYRMLREFDNYDILGHLTVIDRYVGDMLEPAGSVPCRHLYDYGFISDVIDEILRLQIERGKAVEINSSSFNYRMGTFLPRESVLRRYRELGGEMITFGSDAHSPLLYRSHFEDTTQLAKSIGFEYHCTYTNRKPEFRRIP